MKRRSLFIWALFILVFIFIVNLPVVKVESDTSAIRNVYPSNENPIRLKIPKINVDAAVESLGLTNDGIMDAPQGPENVGWYNKGPTPGQQGSAVMDGHSGWENGTPAVFDNLHKLQKGDLMYIEKENGIILTFIVREIKTFDAKADTSMVFESDDGKVHLNLITCTGVWNSIRQTSSKRLVVFTDQIQI